MRSLKVALSAILLISSSGAAFAQAPAPLRWKAVLMGGDDSIEAFDRARKAVKATLVRMGLDPSDIRELSASMDEQLRGVMVSTPDNLEIALRQLGVGRGDACFLHLTSHGSQSGFYVKGFVFLTPARLNSALDAGCGEQPTVVLVSACYSGIFIDKVMQKPNRIILTAAAEDRTSFGCSAENDYTYWDGCLIDNLARSDGWRTLFNAVAQCIEMKESRGNFQASKPQGFMGNATRELTMPGTVAVALANSPPGSASRCAAAKDTTYGMSVANPIKVGLDAATGPARQFQYLNSLRGPSGQAVQYRRVGTASSAGTIFDVYDLAYPGLQLSIRVYLDSYHFDPPTAPPGFICGLDIGLGPR
jgi:hypothetical protein